jgi:hypothetical protein
MKGSEWLAITKCVADKVRAFLGERMLYAEHQTYIRFDPHDRSIRLSLGGRDYVLLTQSDVESGMYETTNLLDVKLAIIADGATPAEVVARFTYDPGAAAYFDEKARPTDASREIRAAVSAFLAARGVPEFDGPAAAVFFAGGHDGSWHDYVTYANGMIKPGGAPRAIDRSLNSVDRLIENAVRTFRVLLDNRDARVEPMPCAVVWRLHPEIVREKDGRLSWHARCALVPLADAARLSVDRPEPDDGIPPVTATHDPPDPCETDCERLRRGSVDAPNKPLEPAYVGKDAHPDHPSAGSADMALERARYQGDGPFNSLVWMPGWSADVLATRQPDNGWTHVTGHVVGNTAALALEGAQWVLGAWARDRECFIRCQPQGESDTDFETGAITHKGYVRFSFGPNVGERTEPASEDGGTRYLGFGTVKPLAREPRERNAAAGDRWAGRR